MRLPHLTQIATEQQIEPLTMQDPLFNLSYSTNCLHRRHPWLVAQCLDTYSSSGRRRFAPVCMLALPTDALYARACYVCIWHLYLAVLLLACFEVTEMPEHLRP